MNANVESEANNNAFDKVKYVAIAAVLVAAVVGNQAMDELPLVYRAGGFVVAVIIAGLIAMQTDKGRQFMTFAKESRTEVRKVVWPNRQEATHTTLIIAAATVVMAIFMWGLDAVLLWVVGLLTGLRF
jgi:preprotein translocase subunit SecE